ncbi:MAG: hypothetical protein KJZ96_17010 [Rhodocyclaceae bacterium]|jgi:hypothetical protein|nr:hypothetical protein [Rhodocyclaceae bacterium]MCL4760039.1 hypothetical protein [Rhodocyclaceae bacterium]
MDHRHLLFAGLISLLIVGCGGGGGGGSNAAEPSAPAPATTLPPGTTLRVAAAPEKGFHYPYYLHVPANVTAGGNGRLIVESNNTGTISDDQAFHDGAVQRSLANVGSIGQQVATRTGNVFLMPAFVRPATKWDHYTHSLDRDTLVVRLTAEERALMGNFERIDLQLLAMIADARERLGAAGYRTADRVWLTGFSASGVFANRFAALHPTAVEAVAAGGVNATAFLPVPVYNGVVLPYPMGTSDMEQVVGKPFEPSAYAAVRQFLFMGSLDTNDATEYRDAWSEQEAQLWWTLMGRDMPGRWVNLQNALRTNLPGIVTRSYGIGHTYNSEVLNDVTNFLRAD